MMLARMIDPVALESLRLSIALRDCVLISLRALARCYFSPQLRSLVENAMRRFRYDGFSPDDRPRSGTLQRPTRL